MSFQDLLERAKGLKAETLPQALPELFRGIYEAGLLDTEVEALFQAIRKATGVSKGALLKDWGRYRAIREAQAKEAEAPELTPEDEEAARELSQAPGLLHRAIRTLGGLGVVGEEENRGLLYLALLSSRTEEPISVLVKGRSSSGKSHLVRTALRLIPPRGYYELTAMSAKALVYADLDFSHRHLVLYEEDGLAQEEVLYLVRTLLSEGQIRYLTTEKSPNGRLVGREIIRPGPTGLITTMTKGLTKEDNETRTLSLYMDDTKAHTLRVVEAVALWEAQGGAPAPDLGPWHALYHALPQKPVRVPFAPAVARLLQAQDLPEDLTRLRRDFKRFLNLVKVVALLHHARREEREGALLASLKDYALAYHLAARPLARSVHTVSPQALKLALAVREVYETKLVEAMDKKKEPALVAVYVKEIAKALRWATRTVHKWLEQAEAAGLVEVHKDGNRLRILPNEDAPVDEAAFRLLPEPEALAREVGEALEYVHPLSGEHMRFSSSVQACKTLPEEATSALPDEENPLARPVHALARPGEEAAPGRENPRAQVEGGLARPAHEEVEVEI